MARVKLCINRKFCASKSPTFHILTVGKQYTKLRLVRNYSFILLLTFSSCNETKNKRETQFNYSCDFASSTPTNLAITNNTDQEIAVTLSVKEDKLNKFKDLIFSPNESIEICVDFEGPITKGLFIEFEDKSTRLELLPQQSNKFTLKDRILN